MNSNIEREHRFLIKHLPERSPDNILIIEQGYLIYRKDLQIRVRRTQPCDHSYYSIRQASYEMTVKNIISSTERHEYNHPITHGDYIELIKQAQCVVYKNRHLYHIGTYKNPWEIDMFKLDVNHIYIAEYELGEKEEIVVPQLIKELMPREVNDEPMYSNYRIGTIQNSKKI